MKERVRVEKEKDDRERQLHNLCLNSGSTSERISSVRSKYVSKFSSTRKSLHIHGINTIYKTAAYYLLSSAPTEPQF
jgi:hypothetical protein